MHTRFSHSIAVRIFVLLTLNFSLTFLLIISLNTHVLSQYMGAQAEVYVSAILLVAIVLLYALSYIAVSRVTGGLHKIAQATIKIASGDLSTPIDVTSKNEVGALAIAVRHLAAQIDQLIHSRVEAVKMEKEMETAKTVQNLFLLPEEIKTPFIHLYSRFRSTSQCGGDWSGHFCLPQQKELLIIADAAGHGVPAALVTAMTFAMSNVVVEFVDHEVFMIDDLAALLLRFNEVLWCAGKGELTMTLFVALLDVTKKSMQFINAAHVPPMLIFASDDDHRVSNLPFGPKGGVLTLAAQSDPVGLLEIPNFEQHEISLKSQDKLVLFTDGIFAGFSEEADLTGRNTFRKTIERYARKSPEQLRDLLFSPFQIIDSSPEDDVTLLVAEVR